MTDDKELIQAMLRGDQRAFQRFFEAYAARLGAFAARRSSLTNAAVEDVVQLTMINAMRSLKSFRGEATLFTWLCQICRRHLADVHRKAQRQPRIESYDEIAESRDPAVVIQFADFRDPLDECESDSTRGAVRRAINTLSPQHARILELRFGDDLTLPEIAQSLGVTVDAAESSLVRARKAFREAWSMAVGGTEESRSTMPARRPAE